ncbi:MAG: RNA polymerase sigma factor [Victivallales bacterium]
MPDDMEIARIIQKKFQDDDPSALELAYEHFGRRLYGYLVSMVKSHSDADEVLSELFMTVARKREQIGRASNLRTYLFAIARNLAFEMFRKRTSQKETLSEYAQYLEADEDGGGKWGADELDAVRKAVDGLPEEQREVVVLKIFEGMTFEEISQLMRISQNTAASRYRYAIEKLREQLKGFGYE